MGIFFSLLKVLLLIEDDNTAFVPTPCNIESDKSTLSEFLEGCNTNKL
jgi:hypothetical protein